MDIYLLKKSLHDILADYGMKSGMTPDLEGIHRSMDVEQLLQCLGNMYSLESEKGAEYSEAVSAVSAENPHGGGTAASFDYCPVCDGNCRKDRVQ